MNDRRVLVTGGAGYVGSHACKALRHAGWEPIVLDDLSAGHRDAVRWGPLEQGDVVDRAFVDAVFDRWKPAAVLHFAALADVAESVTNPLRYWRVNVGGTVSLLEGATRAGVRAFVLSSSAATYGSPERLPIPEDHPQRPINPYGATKLAAERVVADCAQAGGPAHASLRYFNAAGADPDGEIGERHEPEPHLIPRLLRAARDGGPEVPIYGVDWPTHDGTCVRDFVHVADLAEAHVRALDLLLEGRPVGELNLGTGRGASVREVLAAVRAVTGREVPVRTAPRRAGDAAELLADPERARDVLGWTARWTDRREIVATAWRWMQAQEG
jgi:UDP-arabinose 4-epimerase